MLHVLLVLSVSNNALPSVARANEGWHRYLEAVKVRGDRKGMWQSELMNGSPIPGCRVVLFKEAFPGKGLFKKISK